MEFESLLSRVALALGIGLLIGLERGWRTRTAESGSRAAGVRTFAISGLLGGIAGAIAQTFNAPGGSIFLSVSFAAYAAVMTTFCRDENAAEGTFSATTAIAGLLTFTLGAYAIIGDERIAAAAAIAATGLLAIREELHGLVEKITWPELRSGLLLLAMTFIALPLIPSEPIGPFGGVNPREVWIIAILLACVSFVGYAAVKYLGASRGVLLAAAAGGLVSSTAVTVTNARRAAAHEGSPELLAAGVSVATAVSFLRVFTLAALLQPKLLIVIGPTLIGAAAAAVGIAMVSSFWRNPGAHELKVTKFRNPFGFWSVTGLAMFLGTIIVLGRAVGESIWSRRRNRRRDRGRARRRGRGDHLDGATAGTHAVVRRCCLCHSRGGRQRYRQQGCHWGGHRPWSLRGGDRHDGGPLSDRCWSYSGADCCSAGRTSWMIPSGERGKS